MIIFIKLEMVTVGQLLGTKLILEQMQQKLMALMQYFVVKVVHKIYIVWAMHMPMMTHNIQIDVTSMDHKKLMNI